MPMLKSSVMIVLNYNGRGHLDDCLNTAILAAKTLEGTSSVLVLDNHSTDPDAHYIEEHFPEVELIVTEKNDMLFSLNKVVAQRSEEIVILLNNDMRFKEDFAKHLLKHFDDENVFAVTAKVMNWQGTQIVASQRRGYFRNAWFYKEWNPTTQKSCLSLDAGGGYAAFRRSMFMALGGFDTLFRPGYWEDTDLSYRAWQKGWKVVYEPAAVICHKISASFDLHYGKKNVEELIRRNEILFTVKNCGGFGFLVIYFLMLPVRFFRSSSTNPALFWGALKAIPKIPLALFRRIQNLAHRKVADEIFLEQIKKSSF